jgi:hypothetical protein
VLNRELPTLEALNQGLNEVIQSFKLDDAKTTGSESGSSTDSKKLPFPLYVKSDHVYTMGLLTGANPTLPELVEPLKDARSKIERIAAVSVCKHVTIHENSFAGALARAALARAHPRCKIEGSDKPIDQKSLLALVSDAPDLPESVMAAQPPAKKDKAVVRS